MTSRLCRTLLAAFAAILSTASQAQLFRTYLASDGSDSNPCTLALPCRLLPAALTAVADGGEIWMLDSANFNTGLVTVGKSVSIRAVPGVVGSLVSTGGPGTAAVRVTAGGLDVALRNVSIGPIAGGSASYYGVHVTGVSEVTIDGCVIENLAYEAVRVAGTGSLRVIDSVLRNNAGWAVNAQAGASVSISGTKMLGNGSGVLAYGNLGSTTTTVSISDSVLTGSFRGFDASTAVDTAVARMTITRSKMDYNSYAVRSETDGVGTGTAVVSVSNSLISNNGVAWFQNGTGSTLYSLGNNHVADNGANVGSVSPLGSQ
jgi:hypothetical protein